MTPISNTSFSISLPFQQDLSNNFLTFDKPFKTHVQANFTTVDPFTQYSFKELSQKNLDEKLPYFLAITEDKIKKIALFDAVSLMRHLLQFQNRLSPLNREEIMDGKIYRLESGSAMLEEFCSLDDLLQMKVSLLYHLMASDPNCPPTKRGECRYHLGGFYEFRVERLDKAEFWYRKAAEDQYYAAHIALASWFDKGTNNFPVSLIDTFKELSKALPLSPPEVSEVLRIKINALNVLIENTKGR